MDGRPDDYHTCGLPLLPLICTHQKLNEMQDLVRGSHKSFHAIRACIRLPDRVDTDFAVANAAVMLRENWLGAAEGNGTCINETEYRPHGQLAGWLAHFESDTSKI